MKTKSWALRLVLILTVLVFPLAAIADHEEEDPWLDPCYLNEAPYVWSIDTYPYWDIDEGDRVDFSADIDDYDSYYFYYDWKIYDVDFLGYTEINYSSSSSPYHYFYYSGTFMVELTVTDDCGNVSNTVRTWINVLPPEPRANFTLKANTISDEEQAVVYLRQDPYADYITIDWGDGTWNEYDMSTRNWYNVFTHRYPSPRNRKNYVITVEASNAKGWDTRTDALTVQRDNIEPVVKIVNVDVDEVSKTRRKLSFDLKIADDGWIQRVEIDWGDGKIGVIGRDKVHLINNRRYGGMSNGYGDQFNVHYRVRRAHNYATFGVFPVTVRAYDAAGFEVMDTTSFEFLRRPVIKGKWVKRALDVSCDGQNDDFSCSFDLNNRAPRFIFDWDGTIDEYSGYRWDFYANGTFTSPLGSCSSQLGKSVACQNLPKGKTFFCLTVTDDHRKTRTRCGFLRIVQNKRGAYKFRVRGVKGVPGIKPAGHWVPAKHLTTSIKSRLGNEVEFKGVDK
jgi:hypothetical protein